MVANQQTLSAFRPTGHEDYDMLVGMDVFTRDGDKVGKVKSVFHPREDFESSLGRHYFLLEPGKMKDWFGGLDESYLPESAISGTTTEGIILNMSEDQIKSSQWEKPAVVGSYRRV